MGEAAQEKVIRNRSLQTGPEGNLFDRDAYSLWKCNRIQGCASYSYESSNMEAFLKKNPDKLGLTREKGHVIIPASLTSEPHSLNI